MTDYRVIADIVAADIANGVLAPGAQLPPQRRFAFERGIAAATASRVYAELIRRGLISGEVGRGSFVRPLHMRRTVAWHENTAPPIDMQLAIANLSDMPRLLEGSLQRFIKGSRLPSAFDAIGPAGPLGAGEAAAHLLDRAGWRPDPASILFPGSGRQGIAAAMAGIAKPGARIGVEPLTYPTIIGLAPRLGIELITLEIDREGVVPDSLRTLHRAKPLAGVYLQPTLHNPLGMSMGEGRLKAIAQILEENDLPCIEDGVFSFLAGGAPLAAHAPNHVVYLDSLSKRLATGSGVGFIAAPRRWRDSIASAMRVGGWTALSLPLALAIEWITDGSVSRVSDRRRRDAPQRQALARRILADATWQAAPSAYHLWLELPDPWRSPAFVAAAASRGVAVAPSDVFAVRAGHAPNAVRISLSLAPLPDLERGLATLASLMRSGPEQASVE